MIRISLCLLLINTWPATAAAHENGAHARYIANMGAMIERGDSKVLFDPLFHHDYENFALVPSDIESGLLAGTEPWGDVDAIFISHSHEDHLDPATILSLMRTQPAIELFAPEQAAAAIRELVVLEDDPVLERVHALALENGEVSMDLEFDSLLVEAIRIPHAGWPDKHSDIENLVFRVTIDNHTTVMHLGDAEPADELYDERPDYWRARKTHFAMLPFWFYISDEGRRILDERINADHAVGMHVPKQVPGDSSERPEPLRDVDLFTVPGETREISVPD